MRICFWRVLPRSLMFFALTEGIRFSPVKGYMCGQKESVCGSRPAELKTLLRIVTGFSGSFHHHY